jgi:hypothetical protein
MGHHAVKLTADQLKQTLEKTTFQEIVSKNDAEQAGVRAATIPLQVKNASASFYVRVDEFDLVRKNKDTASTVIGVYAVSIQSCSGLDKCEIQSEKAEENALELKNWKMLPKGVEIAKVFFGDENKDGWNDVLLQFSNGAGILYRSSKPPPPPRPMTDKARAFSEALNKALEE